LALTRSPRPSSSALVNERVSILIPMRNEADRLRPCLESVLAQQGLDDLEILVLDDGSTDGTGGLVRSIAGGDPRVRVIDGVDAPPPSGWLGKPWACQRLGESATGEVVVFVDADVVLAPTAVVAAVAEMRHLDVALVSPYPRQEAGSWLGFLTQPMVTWSWIATLPMLLARGRSPVWSAAIGQFMVIDAAAYRAAGGHSAVAGHVVEDVEVLRALKRKGFRGLPLNGGRIATCRMYDSAHEVYEGYCKSLWSVFGSTSRGLGGMAAMVGIFVVPPAVAVLSRDRAARRWGVLGYASGVASRALVARATGEPLVGALAMPASAGAFAALTGASLVRRRKGRLQWKGRTV
jgi:GT2 family glycosyltransferase